MLELVHDSRTGERLEIVIPTFNEANRIVNVVNYYAPYYDIVILDDDSTDNTQQRVIEAGGSVFRRTVKEFLSEAHLAYYVNTLTKSDRVFYLFADEFVALADMQEADQQLFIGKCLVLGRRIDWMYGERLNPITSGMPRGFYRGSAEWVEGTIHNALRHRNTGNRPLYCVDVHHLNVILASSQCGSMGKYAGLEIADFRKTHWPFLRFLRRFFVSEILLLPRKLWRQRDKHWTILIQLVLFSLTVSLIGLLCWIEAKFLPGLEEQRDQYAGFYHPMSEGKGQDRKKL